ncbi:hypothetical protein D5086_026805 [Populus alba]|uniref:Uncharacterized protein n=1 Tax=Populus alba TaxID=43335 RepID=A0ACC4B3M0_POPAL
MPMVLWAVVMLSLIYGPSPAARCRRRPSGCLIQECSMDTQGVYTFIRWMIRGVHNLVQGNLLHSNERTCIHIGWAKQLVEDGGTLRFRKCEAPCQCHGKIFLAGDVGGLIRHYVVAFPFLRGNACTSFDMLGGLTGAIY